MKHKKWMALFAAAALVLAGCSTTTEAGPTKDVPTLSPKDAMAQTVKFATSGQKAKSKLKIAYVSECATDLYCQARWKGAQDAAADFGLDITLFDPNYDADVQIRQVQDAVLQNFDGYVLSPVTGATGCAALKTLQQTQKPISTINSPMCGNDDFTPGTVGFVGIQTTSYFTDVIAKAVETCAPDCRVVMAGGYLGSDLYNRWVAGMDNVMKKDPSIKLVAQRPANFSPADALTVVRDALAADPTVNLVIVSSDPATIGAEQAIRDAGLVPGKDVAIYSIGATAEGLARVKSGAWAGTAVLLPYDEAYFGVAQLARQLITGTPTPGFANLALSPSVVDGPGSPFITKDNADKFTPQW